MCAPRTKRRRDLFLYHSRERSFTASLSLSRASWRPSLHPGGGKQTRYAAGVAHLLLLSCLDDKQVLTHSWLCVMLALLVFGLPMGLNCCSPPARYVRFHAEQSGMVQISLYAAAKLVPGKVLAEHMASRTKRSAGQRVICLHREQRAT